MFMQHWRGTKSLSKWLPLVAIFGGVFVVYSGDNFAAEAASTSVNSVIATSTPIAVSFMLSMLVLKVTAFVLGYLIVKLGHDTLIKGVTGEIDFGFSGSGFETKLKSASPGAFFILMGSAIIIWGLTVEKPFSIEIPPQSQNVSTTNSSPSANNTENLHRPPVPK